MLNILLSGVGGQGTVLASKIIAKSAIMRGEIAHTAETIGMAQRGGCVVSHVRLGSDAYSPLIPLGQADVIIAFEPAEAVRVLPYLKKNGTVIVNSSAVKPVTDSLSKNSYSAEPFIEYLKNQDIEVIVIDGAKVIKECGSAKVLNVALLGAAAAKGAIGIGTQELEHIIKTALPEKFCELNLKAARLGAQSI